MYRKIIIVTLLIILVGCGEQPESNTIAEDNETTVLTGEYDDIDVLTVGGRSISGTLLAFALEPLGGDSLQVNQKLDGLINRMLILQDAYNRGLDSTRDMELYYYERETEKLQDHWMQWILDQKVTLSPDTVEEYYSQMGTMLIYTAITVGDRALSDSLRHLILNGDNMRDLAEEYSINPREAFNRGVLGPVDSREPIAGDYMLLQGLETGELSPIDSSRSGWRFLRIDSTYQEAPPPLDEIRDLITARILGVQKVEYKTILFDSLRTVNNFQIVDGMPELISSHFPRNSRNYEPFTSDQEDMAAYTFTGGERTLYYFVENIRILPPIESTQPDDPAWIKEYSLLLGLNDIMAMEARKLGMDTLPDIVAYVERRFSNQLLDVYYAEVIEPRLIPTDEQLWEIYETEQDLLIVPEERVFKVVCAVGEEQLYLLDRVMASGDDPFSVAEELTIVPSILAPGELVITRPMTASSIPPPWDDVLFSAEMNVAFTCSIEAERVMLFELTEIVPEYVAAFNESQDKLLTIYRSLAEEEVVSGLVDSLSSIYHIEIDRGFVDRFIYTESIDQP